MRITIESTTALTYVNDVPCRLWEGRTESGVQVQCLITRIAAHESQDLTQFERELTEQRAPSLGPNAFPLRMIL
jgi:hypothetical protein